MCVLHKRKEVKQRIREEKGGRGERERKKDMQDSSHMLKPHGNDNEHKHTSTSRGGAQRQAHEHKHMPITSKSTCQRI
jgi:hypothetical protein